MPCELEFTEYFVNKLKGCSEQKQSNIRATLGKMKKLERPDYAGGLYQHIYWAYSVPSRSALICRIDIALCKIRVIDIIFHL